MQKRTERNTKETSVTTVITNNLKKLKNMNAKVLSTVIATVMLIASMGFVTNYYTLGYNVYYGDVAVGVASTKEHAMEAYNDAATDVAACYRGELDFDLSFAMTIASVNDITTSDIYRGIVEAAEGIEPCYSIVAEGVEVAKLKLKSDCERAIAEYVAGFEREDAEIFTGYTIANSKGLVTDLVSVSEAVELIEASNLFTVVYKDVTEEEIELGYEESIVYDEAIPEGARVVKQKGCVGRGVRKNITFFENGVKKHNIEAVVEVSAEPVEEIVHIGTGKMDGLAENSLPWPSSGTFTSEYGRRWGRNHNGIDIAAKPGTPIYAPEMGTVTFSGKRNGYGNYVTIDHGNGYVTTYAHMTKRTVSEGDVVAAGDLIGTVGSTGRVTGPHLHFEILKDGRFVDPMNYIGA